MMPCEACFLAPVVSDRRAATRRSALSPKRPAKRTGPQVFRTIGRWKCVKNCGACCYLDAAEREDLETLLSEEQMKLYQSMVAEDGWCKHYEKSTRTCSIFEERPTFCRVSKDELSKVLDFESAEEFEDAAIDMCMDHIFGIYGPRSSEMQRYTSAVGVDLDTALSESEEQFEEICFEGEAEEPEVPPNEQSSQDVDAQ
mmetsp:Transcript_175/g.554  ORF Transcript_175/g.554 Transcript_175/m.554 type:complete len:199 (+) Transcript_175:59-655(+)